MTNTETFILFTVAGTTYALRSRDVAHVEMVEQVTAVPNAAAFVDGVVFSRGQVVPGVEPARAVRFRARALRRDDAAASSRSSAGRSVGLVVDAAREFVVVRPGARSSRPGSALTGLSGRYLEGIANVGDRLILVLESRAGPDVRRSGPRGAVVRG